MRRFPVLIAIAAASLAGSALAQGRVSVALGRALQAKIQDYGPRDVEDLRRELGRDVERALVRSPNAPVAAQLVIEDAQPNRPTFEQLGRTPGLSLRSVGVGGARVSGTVTFRDGSIRPIHYQWYETDITQERAAGTWSDAYRAFGWLADQLASGRTPDAYRGPGPTGSGHFGYPYTGQ